MKITNFTAIDLLYSKGVTICKGCKREHYASCNIHCYGNQFKDCNEQAKRYANEIKALRK